MTFFSNEAIRNLYVKLYVTYVWLIFAYGTLQAVGFVGETNCSQGTLTGTDKTKL